MKEKKTEQGASAAAKFDTLIGKAHAALKNDIIVGHYRPGEKLRVEHLKSRYGVSSGTLREALTMLIADRLVVAEGQRGFRVKQVSPEDLLDLNRIRILLEKEAIRQSIAHGDEEWEGEVVSSFHLLSRATKLLSGNIENHVLFDEWERRHRDFHSSLFSATPSEWTRYFLTVSYQQFERYRHLFLTVAQANYLERDVELEHREILNAVLERDADKAAALLEKHLLRTLDEWVQHFENTDFFEFAKVALNSGDGSEPVADH